MQTINCQVGLITQLEPKAQEEIDSLIYETNAKLEAIVEEMRAIKFSDLNDVEKREKTDRLRVEFEKILSEQQKKVERIMKENRPRRSRGRR